MMDLSGIENFVDAAMDHASRSSAAIFGITATTPQMPAAGRIAEAIRSARPDARIILGGPHITLVNAAVKREMKLGYSGRASHAMKNMAERFDVLVAGDGELAIFRAIAPGASFVDADIPSSDMFLTDSKLNELPWPARHLVDVSSYHYHIEEERSLSLIAQLGCPFCLRILRGPRVTDAAENTNPNHRKHHRRNFPPPRTVRGQGLHVLRR